MTGDELDRAAGNLDQVIGALRKRYGYEWDRAERELGTHARTWSQPTPVTVRPPGSAP